MGTKKSSKDKNKSSKFNKNKKRNNPQKAKPEETYNGLETHEKYIFSTIFVGGIIFLLIYLGGLLMFLL